MGMGRNFSNRSRVASFSGGVDNVGQSFVTIFGHVNGDAASAPAQSGFFTGQADQVTVPLTGFEAFLLAAAISYGATGDGTISRIRLASATTLSALSSESAQVTTPPGNWSVAHTPAITTQATITRAAGAAGVVHVCTSIDAVLIIPETVNQGLITLNLRDGATGLGTILWSRRFGIGAALTGGGQQEVSLSGLNIVGSAATAMTLEFSAAGAATTSQSVAMTGYDAHF